MNDQTPLRRDRASAVEATRASLILAAEALFAESGVEAVPFRAICNAAGQRNPSCVHYHFGDREGLLSAIFEYREAQIEPDRIERLARIRREGLEGNPRELIRAMYEPYARLCFDHEGLSYLKLISFYMNHMRPAGVAHPADRRHRATSSSRQLIGMLRRRLSFLSPALFDLRMECQSVAFMSAFTQHALRPAGERLPDAVFLEDLLEMIGAAFCALPPGAAS